MAKSPPTPWMILTALLALDLALLLIRPAAAQEQDCDCQPGFCCSQYGYCGTTGAYCGLGCRSGPCWGSGGGGGGTSVASVVTPAFFDGIKSHAGSGCAGTAFYTRRAFLSALRAYPGFGTGGGSAAADKREIAAFFAHVTHETGYMCYINEIAKAGYCNEEDRQWPCYPGQSYYGRGPLQLSWNYNYGMAGRSLGFDGLRDPDLVARDPVLSFKTALWFWMANVHPVMGQGFGATIRAINGGECHGGNTAEMEARVQFYLQYCAQLGIQPGADLTC